MQNQRSDKKQHQKLDKIGQAMDKLDGNAADLTTRNLDRNQIPLGTFQGMKDQAAHQEIDHLSSQVGFLILSR